MRSAKLSACLVIFLNGLQHIFNIEPVNIAGLLKSFVCGGKAADAMHAAALQHLGIAGVLFEYVANQCSFTYSHNKPPSGAFCCRYYNRRQNYIQQKCLRVTG